MPLYPGQDKEVITQFDGPSCEKIGLLKMDFLGLKTLTVLHNTLKRVREQGPDFPYKDLNAVPDNDSRTYDLLNKANTLGVFQLESSGMRDLMKRLGVHEFSDVVALVALYRPGPMQMAEDFIQRKHGKVPVEYLHPCLEPILKETFGIMLYQEQVMQCAQVMADFSMTEADNLRRIMGKKKEKDMKLQHDKFVNGAVNRGISREIADQTFSTMEYFAGYGFNKSHSVAYGRIAYQTAWFKTNYPKEFMAALLSSEKNDTDKIYLYIEECRSMGIEVKPPSIQYSYVDFNVEKNSIRYGLSAIKNVGEGAAQAIVRARGKEPFESITHFAKKVDSRALNKKTLESLIKAGAFDELEKNRHYLFEITDDIIRFGSGSQKDQALGQESFFTILDSASSTLTPKKKEDYPNWPDHDTLRFERELLGCYLSGHPLVKYFKLLKRFSTTHTKEIIHFKDGDSIKIGGVISFIRHTKTSKDEKMAILQLEDLKGTVEIVVFPRKLKECEPLLKMESPVFIQGTMHSRNKVPGIILENITPLQDVQEKLTTSVLIRIDESEGEKGLNQLKEIIHKYPGRSQVLLDLQLASGESMMVSAENGLTLLPSESAISEIESLLGEDSVWLRIKDKPRQTFNPRRK
ncbi:MAG: DNA polymerase III subunit alpha, partial [Candidatus Aureabacteria bacterium]|nr:DNA polymerase III subunit alpha [Candidatus Auribacterota bacterium]